MTLALAGFTANESTRASAPESVEGVTVTKPSGGTGPCEVSVATAVAAVVPLVEVLTAAPVIPAKLLKKDTAVPSGTGLLKRSERNVVIVSVRPKLTRPAILSGNTATLRFSPHGGPPVITTEIACEAISVASGRLFP